jgi:hypothetical protein
MARREMSMSRYEEIKRLLDLGRSVREIAGSLQCHRRTVRDIRDGKAPAPEPQNASLRRPIWSESMDWQEVLEKVLVGDPLKYIWEDQACEQVTYVNFWKQFHRQFPSFRSAKVCHRVFAPGERCEVDYAGKKEKSKIEWVDLKTGLCHTVEVFVGILGFSQLIFACARANAKTSNFLDCHLKMYDYFGGVPQVTVPDCLKQGVSKCHLYDPDLNPAYQALAQYYGSAIVPARPRRPKDKALVENAVRLIMRYFRYCYRNHIFTSLAEINHALLKVCNRINQKKHTRFQTSRFLRWQQTEQSALHALPETPFEIFEYKQAKVHPDCHIKVGRHYYSVPHVYRGRTVEVKLTQSQVEIFFERERLACHSLGYGREGTPVTKNEHLPENARAYHEATPQNLLAQAKYVSPDLHALLEGLFHENTMGHLRRAQGLIREARKEFNLLGRKKAQEVIERAVQTMVDYDRIRVPYFKDLLERYRKENHQQKEKGHIERRKENPHLRHTAKQQTLKLVQ